MSLKVAVVQLTSGENVTQNVNSIIELADQAPADSDLICLPENSLFFRISKATPMISLELHHPEILRLKEYVDRTAKPIILGSVPLKEKGKPSNSTVFLEPGAMPQVLYSKLHLFDVDVPGAPSVRESETFEYGSTPVIWRWRNWDIGLSICYDLRFAELYNIYGKHPVDLILVPSAFLVPTGKAHWEPLLRARAIENQAFLVAAAQSGEHLAESSEKRYTYGHSMVIDPWGQIILELTQDHRIGVVNLEKNKLNDVRKQIPMREHRLKRSWEDK